MQFVLNLALYTCSRVFCSRCHKSRSQSCVVLHNPIYLIYVSHDEFIRSCSSKLMIFNFRCGYPCTRPKMSLLSMLRSWRFWIRLLILLFYVVLIVVILPLLLVNAVNDALNQKFYTSPIIGGVFVIMTLPIAFRLIGQHMLFYSKPKLQKHIIR